ncbi:MAG: acetate--CoA ligase family protein [Paracoccaceae bacterium]
MSLTRNFDKMYDLVNQLLHPYREVFSTKMKTAPRRKLRENLSTLLKPKNFVCIGGSQATGCIQASRRAGFKGKIWVVNPSLRPIDGAEAVASVSDLPISPDAALIAVSAERTPEVVKQLSDVGTKGAVSIASGFAEVDEHGKKLQNEIKKLAGEMAFLGPNGMGMINFFDGIAIWGSDNHMNKVKGHGAAFISQSGAFVYNSSNVETGFPLGYAISTGNQAVIDISDCIDVVMHDKRVRAIGIYIEGIDDANSLGAACWKALKKGIPIVALRGGSDLRSEEAITSHTGSIVVDNSLWEAFKNRYGIAEVKTPKSLIETLKFMSISGVPKGKRLGAVTYSGGLNNLIASQVSKSNIELPRVPATNKAKLKSIMPSTVTVANPLDMNFPFSSKLGISMENGMAIAEAIYIFAKGMADMVVFFIDIPRKGNLNINEVWIPSIKYLNLLVKKLNVPIAVGSTFPEGIEPEIKQMLIEKGVAPLLGLDDVLTALNTSIGWQLRSESLSKKNCPRLLEHKGKNMTQCVLKSESESKDILKEYGVNFPRYREAHSSDLIRVASELEYPIALKICSKKIIHKDSMGGVKLNLSNEMEVLEASKVIAKNYFQKFGSSFSGKYLLEKMIDYRSQEYIIGAKKDAKMGISIIVGKGGIDVEEAPDIKILLCPLISEELKSVLENYNIREGTSAHKSLKILIQAVEKYVTKNIRNFKTLDLNPVVIDKSNNAIALDALIMMEK